MAKIVKSYKGAEVELTEEGWFNATNVAEKFGKRPVDWFENKDTIDYINAVAKFLNVPKEALYKTKRGKMGGTWLHPKLGVRFAQWLDLDFAVWCDIQIDGIIRGTIDAKRLRHEAASSYKVMSSILQMSREAIGKPTKPHHYINEALLINLVLTGKRESVDRDGLDDKSLDVLAKLEDRNSVLIAQGVPYHLRKQALKEFMQSNRMLEAA